MKFEDVKSGGIAGINERLAFDSVKSFDYAVLESEVRKSINAVGLDPTIGFLHEIGESKTPLVYDIQELFRWLVDLSILQLLEEKRLKKADFILTENYHLRLKPATATMLIEKIQLNMNRKLPYKHGKQYSYQTILFDCAQELAKFIIGKRKDLSFTVPELTIQRTDSIDLQRRITLMTPAERKKLGINKSTLWYQKQNLMAGKRIKFHDKVLAKLA